MTKARNLAQAGGNFILTGTGIVRMEIDEIRASDGDGLKLYDDAGAGIFIQDGGNVGLGTTSPDYALDVVLGVGIQEGQALNWHDGSGSNSAQIYGDASDNLIFRNTSSNTECARIDSSGTFRVKGNGTAGVDDAVQLNGSAPANSLRLDASGRLLVGTTSASGTNTLFESSSTAANSANVALVKRNSGTADQAGQQLHFYNFGPSGTARAAGTEVGNIRFYGSRPTTGAAQEMASIQCAADLIQTGANTSGRLVFSTTVDGASTPTPRVQINSSGALQLLAGCPGIDFSAIQANAAGMTSETLDSYEEGTWTPVPNAVGATTQPIYTSSGRYLKIGKLVHLTGYINVTTASTGGVSQTRITGIPFSMGASGSGAADYQPQFTVGAYSAVSASAAGTSTPTGAYVYENAIFLRSLFASTSGSQVNHSWNKVGSFHFSLTYYLL